MADIFDDPELLAKLSEMGLFDEETNLLAKQMARAQALRDTPAATGRTVPGGAGGIYVAASPLEHLSSGLGAVLGQRDINATSAKQSALLERMRSNARGLAQALKAQRPWAQDDPNAATLNQQQDAIALEALTGGPKAGPQVGQLMFKGAQEQREAQTARLRAELQERARQLEQDFRERQLGETSRHNRAMEARPPSSPMAIVTGEGGVQYWGDPRNPGAPVRPMVGPGGAPIVKPKTQRPLGTSDKAVLDSLTGELKALDSLGAKFKPEFAGGGPAGSASTALYQWLGGAGTEGMQRDAAFWADFSRLIDLPQRNAVFGASLSAGEKASWEGAKNIKPSSSPKLVAEKLAEMRQILADKLANVTASLVEEGYDPEAINARTGGRTGGPSAPRRIKVDAQGNVIP